MLIAAAGRPFDPQEHQQRGETLKRIRGIQAKCETNNAHFIVIAAFYFFFILEIIYPFCLNFSRDKFVYSRRI